MCSRSSRLAKPHWFRRTRTEEIFPTSQEALIDEVTTAVGTAGLCKDTKTAYQLAPVWFRSKKAGATEKGVHWYLLTYQLINNGRCERARGIARGASVLGRTSPLTHLRRCYHLASMMTACMTAEACN